MENSYVAESAFRGAVDMYTILHCACIVINAHLLRDGSLTGRLRLYYTRTVGYNIRLWEVMHVECLLTAQGRG